MEMVKRRAEMNREAIDFFNSLFDAGDINGDAALNFDEFESMLEARRKYCPIGIVLFIIIIYPKMRFYRLLLLFIIFLDCIIGS